MRPGTQRNPNPTSLCKSNQLLLQSQSQDCLLKKMIGRKKGGSVNKKKTNKKPRGVGCATRGYGKAMKGTK